MKTNNLIEKKLFGFENFLIYCRESGKKFVDELDSSDFIAYREEYSVPRKKVEHIKRLLNFQEKKPTEKLPPPEDFSNTFEGIFNTFGFDSRVQRPFKKDNATTFADVPKSNLAFKACVRNFLNSLFKNEREFYVVHQQIKGDLNGDIEEILGITDEEFQQIESKSINRFKRNRATAKKIVYSLRELTHEESMLTIDDAKDFLDTFDAKILWFFFARTFLKGKGFYFDVVFDSIIFVNKAVLNKKESSKNLPKVVEKNSPAELIETDSSKTSSHNRKFFHRGKLSLTFKCDYVLKERFPQGYKIGDKTSYSRFVRYIKELFGEKTPLTQSIVDEKIKTIGFRCDRGKYIHPDFVHVSSEILEQIKNFIESSTRPTVFYNEILESLRKNFVETPITNRYFLQSAIKFYDLPYALRKDYLIKAKEIDSGKELEIFISSRSEVSLQDIKENFVAFKEPKINSLIEHCPAIIRIGNGIFIHVKQLNLKSEDFEPLKNFLRKNCLTPINSRVLLDLFFERFADFMKRNEIQNHGKLFGVLQYMFKDDFVFSRPYISASGSKDISNKKFLLSFWDGVEKIELEDLCGICEENGIHYPSKSYLTERLRPDFIRADEFTLRRPESIGVTDEIISAVVENIQSSINRNGGWQVAQTFEDYDWLPQLEIPWNSFLLESVSSLADDALLKIKMPSKITNFSTAIFLAEEFAEDNFQSFITKILSAEHAKEPFQSEEEIFNWLKARSLCNKNLPKFLKGGRALEILSE